MSLFFTYWLLCSVSTAAVVTILEIYECAPEAKLSEYVALVAFAPFIWILAGIVLLVSPEALDEI